MLLIYRHGQRSAESTYSCSTTQSVRAVLAAARPRLVAVGACRAGSPPPPLVSQGSPRGLDPHSGAGNLQCRVDCGRDDGGSLRDGADGGLDGVSGAGCAARAPSGPSARIEWCKGAAKRARAPPPVKQTPVPSWIVHQTCPASQQRSQPLSWWTVPAQQCASPAWLHRLWLPWLPSGHWYVHPVSLRLCALWPGVRQCVVPSRHVLYMAPGLLEGQHCLQCWCCGSPLGRYSTPGQQLDTCRSQSLYGPKGAEAGHARRRLARAQG